MHSLKELQCSKNILSKRIKCRKSGVICWGTCVDVSRDPDNQDKCVRTEGARVHRLLASDVLDQKERVRY